MKILGVKQFFEKLKINPVKLNDFNKIDKQKKYDKIIQTVSDDASKQLDSRIIFRMDRYKSTPVPYYENFKSKISIDKDVLSLSIDWLGIYLPKDVFKNTNNMAEIGLSNTTMIYYMTSDSKRNVFLIDDPEKFCKYMNDNVKITMDTVNVHSDVVKVKNNKVSRTTIKINLNQTDFYEYDLNDLHLCMNFAISTIFTCLIDYVDHKIII